MRTRTRIAKADEPKAPATLTNITVEEVSVVDHPANQRRFIVVKAAAPAVEPAVTETDKAEWTAAYMNDLPDSAFLHVDAGGKKDADGKTVPRGLRHFPVRDNEGAVDLPHLRNALARIAQSNLSDDLKTSLKAKAQKMLENETKKSDETVAPETKVDEVKTETAPAGDVEKAGRKISRKRLATLRDAHKKFSDALADFSDLDNDEVADEPAAKADEPAVKTEAVAEAKVETAKEPAPVVTDVVVKTLAAVADTLAGLQKSLVEQGKQLADLKKSATRPAPPAVGESRQTEPEDKPVQKAATVSWPADMNNPLDRASVEKSISFYDEA